MIRAWVGALQQELPRTLQVWHRGDCATICALLPPYGSSSPERNPRSLGVPRTVIPLGCQTSGPNSSTLGGCNWDLFHTRVLPCSLIPATLNNASPNRSYKNQAGTQCIRCRRKRTTVPLRQATWRLLRVLPECQWRTRVASRGLPIRHLRLV